MTEGKPRIGILGIMQDLYDDMIPGIAQRQAGYAAELAAHLAEVGDFIPSKPIKYREDAEREMREFENAGLDGVLVVMLTYGPAMRVARLLSESRLPVKRISQRCGFGSEETMRRSFLRVLSATPQDYRARFSS